MIDARTRRAIRETHAELLEARAAADAVSRPDGTDGTGHPGIRAANLEGVLGRYALPLLEALEEAEARLEGSMKESVHVAGVPATLTAVASVRIEGVSDPISLPLHVGGATARGIALVLDPGPALEAIEAHDASQGATGRPQSAGEPS